MSVNSRPSSTAEVVRSSVLGRDRSRTVGRSGLALGAVVGVQWGRTARARHTTNSTGRAFHADRARTTGGGRRRDWGCPGRGGYGVLAAARRADGRRRRVYRGRPAMPAVAAVHFLANRDAHANWDSQRLAQPATVHERSDRDHLPHGYSNRLEVTDREHGSL